MQIAGEVLPKIAAPCSDADDCAGECGVHSSRRHSNCSAGPAPARAPGGRRAAWNRRLPCNQQWRIAMGKYFLAWLLGVPAGLLLLIFLVTHLL
jgi:hypothetical protein